MGITLNGGSIKVAADLKNLDRRAIQGLRRGWDAAGRVWLKSIRNEVLRGTKSGKVYKIRRGKSKRNHRASAPGETPANRSGAYRKSMGFQIHGWKALEVGSREGSAGYSMFLEKGTSRMKPRPGIKNAITAESATIQKDVENELRKALA